MRIHIPYAALALTLVAVAPAAAQTSPRAPLYDPAMDPPAGVGPAAGPPPAYQYVYEPGRILLVDPTTGIAMEALPR